MSDLVHWANYNKAPIILWYGTSGSNTFSSSSFRWNGSRTTSKVQMTMRVLEGFALSSLKHHNTLWV